MDLEARVAPGQNLLEPREAEEVLVEQVDLEEDPKWPDKRKRKGMDL